MSKSSRNNGLHKESCRLVGRQLQRLFWMDLWGKPEIGKRVGAYGCPSRYQQGVYVGIQNEWAIYSPMWVAPQSEQLLSLSRDKGVFYLYSLFSEGGW